MVSVKLDDVKPRDKLPTAKRPTKKKPKDKPKRPLSAYNFFFKEEREKILKVVSADDPSEIQKDPEADDYLDEETIGRLKKEGGKVSFEEMGKIIGQRWKNIDPDRLSKYSELASEDTERYKTEMQAYNGRQEAKMRSEALKPPVYAGVPTGPGGMTADRGPGGYPDMRGGAVSGYPDMAGAAYGAGMGGMVGLGSGGMGASAYGGYGDFSGYGGMGMASAYGGGLSGYGGYSQSMEPPPGAYGGSYGSMSMGGGGYQGGMIGYDQYGQPMDQHGAYGGYGAYGGPQGGWGQG